MGPSVSDLDTLIAGLRPEVAPVLLDTSEPAPAQIARALAGHSGLARRSRIAHGAPGEVAFAAGPLSLETIDEHRASLAAIGQALEDDGDLLLWSCRDRGRDRAGPALFRRSASRRSGRHRVGASAGLVGAVAQRRGAGNSQTAILQRRVPLYTGGSGGLPRL